MRKRKKKKEIPMDRQLKPQSKRRMNSSRMEKPRKINERIIRVNFYKTANSIFCLSTISIKFG